MLHQVSGLRVFKLHSISSRFWVVVFPLVACWVPGLGLKVGFKVQGLGFGFQVEGLGFGFQFCAQDFALSHFCARARLSFNSVGTPPQDSVCMSLAKIATLA